MSVECVRIVAEVEEAYDVGFEDTLECLFALSDHPEHRLIENVDTDKVVVVLKI